MGTTVTACLICLSLALPIFFKLADVCCSGVLHRHHFVVSFNILGCIGSLVWEIIRRSKSHHMKIHHFTDFTITFIYMMKKMLDCRYLGDGRRSRWLLLVWAAWPFRRLNLGVIIFSHEGVYPGTGTHETSRFGDKLPPMMWCPPGSWENCALPTA